jgi:hypothetical protein
MGAPCCWMASCQKMATHLPNCWSNYFLVLPNKQEITSLFKKLLEMLNETRRLIYNANKSHSAGA